MDLQILRAKLHKKSITHQNSYLTKHTITKEILLFLILIIQLEKLAKIIFQLQLKWMLILHRDFFEQAKIVFTIFGSMIDDKEWLAVSFEHLIYLISPINNVEIHCFRNVFNLFKKFGNMYLQFKNILPPSFKPLERSQSYRGRVDIRMSKHKTQEWYNRKIHKAESSFKQSFKLIHSF